jgi:hypothetical protein
VVMERIEVLARVSEEPDRLTRTFCSPAMRQANELVAGWMREAGMIVSQDAVGNVIGHYPARKEHAKSFILGSHLDTVRDAGKFDGPLGVLAAIACVQHLHHEKIRLPFALEVIGFADEEGVRYQTTYLGSKALTGELKEKDLQGRDANGLSMAEAIRSFGCSATRKSTSSKDRCSKKNISRSGWFRPSQDKRASKQFSPVEQGTQERRRWRCDTMRLPRRRISSRRSSMLHARNRDWSPLSARLKRVPGRAT